MNADLNKVLIAEYFLELVRLQTQKSIHRDICNTKEIQIAQQLLKLFNDLLMDAKFIETEELLQGNSRILTFDIFLIILILYYRRLLCYRFGLC